MTAALVIAAALGYLTVAAATMRVIAWESQRRGRRERELHQFGAVGEILPGLVWPIVLPLFAVGAVLACIHALATTGIDKEGR
jgi:hypothetical protein